MNAAPKTVLITGASSGIGHASVMRMLDAGWRVFASVRKTEDADRLTSESPGITPVILDVTDRPSILAAAERVSSELAGNGLDGLVNVAGIGMARPIEYATSEDMQQIFDINVFGQIAVIEAFLPLIRQASTRQVSTRQATSRKACGRIVNITSVGAHIAIPFGGLLNASKSAFSLLSDTLRMELHPFGIHVCTVEPGAINTPAVEKTLGNIEGVIGKLPARGARQYGDMLRNFAHRAHEREAGGSSPDVVARAVAHALTSRRPRIRYQAGKGAKLLPALATLLPDRMLDAFRLKMLGLPSQFGVLR